MSGFCTHEWVVCPVSGLFAHVNGLPVPGSGLSACPCNWISSSPSDGSSVPVRRLSLHVSGLFPCEWVVCPKEWVNCLSLWTGCLDPKSCLSVPMCRLSVLLNGLLILVSVLFLILGSWLSVPMCRLAVLVTGCLSLFVGCLSL